MPDSRNAILGNKSGSGQSPTAGTLHVEEKEEHNEGDRSSNATPSSPANDVISTAAYDYLDRSMGAPLTLEASMAQDPTDVERGQVNVLNLERVAAQGPNASDLKEVPTFRARDGRRRGASQVPLEMSTLESEIKRRERSIQFQRFLRDRDSRVVRRLNPLLTNAVLRQPKPLALKRGNLLETFGCHPGPGIRENAKFMMQGSVGT